MALHDGHRDRLRNKMDQNALEEHEWLEALLFNAIPRRNTNDIAHRLLAAFGSIPNLFSASYEQLKQVDGVGEGVASYLKCFGHFLEDYYWWEKEAEFFEPNAFRQYVKNKYKYEHVEVMDFYFYNAKRELIYCRRYTCNERELVDIDPSLITGTIVAVKEKGVDSVVIVHNHLSGKCEPSDYDIQATSQVQMIMSIHNILLLDHFIYSPLGVYSFYESGRMLEINQKFNMNAILKNGGVIVE